MANTKIVKLYFKSPLHIGRGLGDAYDTAERVLHSDTISGALTAMFCAITPDGDALEFMKKYRVSSAYPFVNNTFFLPRPLVKVDIEIKDEDEYQQKKKLKKIEYFETTLWQKLVSGRKVDVMQKQLSGNGKFLFANEAPAELPFKDELQQRVTVPRDGGDSKPYYLDRRFFAQDSGLYFFLETDEETEKTLYNILEHLGTTGFGTDKSVGNGQFEVRFAEIDLQLPDEAEKRILISLACPLREEISTQLLQNSAYQMMQRGGFIAGTNRNQFRHLRKKSVYMFVEGSVFSTNQLTGKIENVRPDWNDGDLHPVYKDGRAFCLPVNI